VKIKNVKNGIFRKYIHSKTLRRYYFWLWNVELQNIEYVNKILSWLIFLVLLKVRQFTYIFPNVLKVKRIHRNLQKVALASTVRRTVFGRGYGPLARQTMQW